MKKFAVQILDAQQYNYGVPEMQWLMREIAADQDKYMTVEDMHDDDEDEIRRQLGPVPKFN